MRRALSRFLLHLGATVPDAIALDAIDICTAGADLRGTASGTLDGAQRRTSAYVEQLRRDKRVREIFDDVTLILLGWQDAARHLSFDLFLRFKRSVTTTKGKRPATIGRGRLSEMFPADPSSN
jgi:hypothetical protein